jgi:hypothetical protein
MQEEIVSEIKNVENIISNEVADEDAMLKLNARILEAKDNMFILGIGGLIVVGIVLYICFYIQSNQLESVNVTTVSQQAHQGYSTVSNMEPSSSVQTTQSASEQQVLDLSNISF